jgi:hypothetical protein
LSAIPWPSRAGTTTGPGHRVAQEEQVVLPGQLAGLDDLAVGQSDLGAGGDVEAGLDDAVVAEGDAQAGLRAEQAAPPMRTRSVPPPDRVPIVEAPPPMSEPSPTTTPWEIRPSTIEAPRVPALKLTKPSCMTVVPGARWAPSRTRSASAIRTPDGHDVVDHPRELVDAEDRHRPRRAAGPGQLEPSTGARAAVGPHDVGQHGRRCRRG